jgi:hypothetical protein
MLRKKGSPVCTGRQLQARLRIYKGGAYVDIREWIMKDGGYIKTNRGFMIPIWKFDEFVRFMQKVNTLLNIEK